MALWRAKHRKAVIFRRKMSGFEVFLGLREYEVRSNPCLMPICRATLFMMLGQKIFCPHAAAALPPLTRLNNYFYIIKIPGFPNVSEMFPSCFQKTDSFIRAGENIFTENFYHGMLLGLLRSKESWSIQSNTETEESYSDISICTPKQTGIVIELKYRIAFHKRECMVVMADGDLK